jgi:chromosome segregation ATPase
MTEEQLRASITPCIMSGNTWFVFEEIKSYAASQVAEKEDQITRILSENRALEMTRQRLLFACDANQKAIATKDERIQELGLVIDSFDSEVSAKDARIQELEFVIEYAASSLDLIHPDDSAFMEKLNKIYQNLENKTRYEV